MLCTRFFGVRRYARHILTNAVPSPDEDACRSDRELAAYIVSLQQVFEKKGTGAYYVGRYEEMMEFRRTVFRILKSNVLTGWHTFEAAAQVFSDLVMPQRVQQVILLAEQRRSTPRSSLHKMRLNLLLSCTHQRKAVQAISLLKSMRHRPNQLTVSCLFVLKAHGFFARKAAVSLQRRSFIETDQDTISSILQTSVAEQAERYTDLAAVLRYELLPFAVNSMVKTCRSSEAGAALAVELLGIGEIGLSCPEEVLATHPNLQTFLTAVSRIALSRNDPVYLLKTLQRFNTLQDTTTLPNLLRSTLVSVAVHSSDIFENSPKINWLESHPLVDTPAKIFTAMFRGENAMEIYEGEYGGFILSSVESVLGALAAKGDSEGAERVMKTMGKRTSLMYSYLLSAHLNDFLFTQRHSSVISTMRRVGVRGHAVSLAVSRHCLAYRCFDATHWEFFKQQYLRGTADIPPSVLSTIGKAMYLNIKDMNCNADYFAFVTSIFEEVRSVNKEGSLALYEPFIAILVLAKRDINDVIVAAIGDASLTSVRYLGASLEVILESGVQDSAVAALMSKLVVSDIALGTVPGPEVAAPFLDAESLGAYIVHLAEEGASFDDVLAAYSTVAARVSDAELAAYSEGRVYQIMLAASAVL